MWWNRVTPDQRLADDLENRAIVRVRAQLVMARVVREAMQEAQTLNRLEQALEHLPYPYTRSSDNLREY
jgi:hypothetical protein